MGYVETGTGRSHEESRATPAEGGSVVRTASLVRLHQFFRAKVRRANFIVIRKRGPIQRPDATGYIQEDRSWSGMPGDDKHA
jgi:hypothetical protein